MEFDTEGLINDSAAYKEKQKELFLKQKETLDLFLERKAITQKQYDKSLGDLRDKMGMHGVGQLVKAYKRKPKAYS